MSRPLTFIFGLLKFSLAIIAFCVIAGDLAWAQDGGSGGESWYKVASGIVAIPATALGIWLTWNLSRKARLETQKLELELEDKKTVLAGDMPPLQRLQLLAAPVADNQRALLLILRYIFLELTLRFWNVVPEAIGFVVGMIMGGAMLASKYLVESSSEWVLYATLGVQTGSKLIFHGIYWAIAFGLGWPLFKDTCAFLNIPIAGFADLIKWSWRPPKPIGAELSANDVVKPAGHSGD